MATTVTSGKGRGMAGLALATLVAAAAVATPRSLSGSEGDPACAGPGQPGCAVGVVRDPLRARRLARLESHLAGRMSGLDPALHEDLARAILEEAEAARLDPLLVLAVIEVESGYDPSAVSAAGAVGLMQLLPGTLQREATGRGGAAATGDGPVGNVRAGIRYLRRCLDSYPEVDVALMAYNAGPNRLHAWHLADAVPLEVRGYARRVLEGQVRLRHVLTEETAPLLADLRPLDG
jgi:soluble lytic murein transglycosylase-like protein